MLMEAIEDKRKLEEDVLALIQEYLSNYPVCLESIDIIKGPLQMGGKRDIIDVHVTVELD